ncbi:response regulator transcription factor [Amaricoccus tamworthensis]|uniref:response regulator transcription factor n=1 Tax=Amaricoccus tamworthensis TaxID=57002 RepID=UPI003C79D0EC
MTTKVLIVEDELNITESLTFLLSREGFEVTSCADGAVAIQSVDDTAPDVLILDVMLPGLDGFEIIRRLRADGEHRNLPILVLSAKGQRRDRMTAETSGADMFMPKPFSNSEVVDAVKKLAG